MTPNTLRIALSLVVLGAAPVGLAAFPQQALAGSCGSNVEQQANSDAMTPVGMETEAVDVNTLEADMDVMAPAEMDMEAAETEMMEPEAAGDMPEAEAAEAVDTTSMTIAELAASDGNFEVLTAALEAAGLTEALSNNEMSVTVFAPTDDAFAALPEGTVEALLLPENRDQLTQLLTYHVVEGEVLSTDLASGEVGTLAGAPISVMVGEEMVTINQANVVVADIEASNGIIHVIDSVLLPM